VIAQLQGQVANLVVQNNELRGGGAGDHEFSVEVIRGVPRDV
jgi:hypothetical protein